MAFHIDFHDDERQMLEREFTQLRGGLTHVHGLLALQHALEHHASPTLAEGCSMARLGELAGFPLPSLEAESSFLRQETVVPSLEGIKDALGKAIQWVMDKIRAIGDFLRTLWRKARSRVEALERRLKKQPQPRAFTDEEVERLYIGLADETGLHPKALVNRLIDFMVVVNDYIRAGDQFMEKIKSSHLSERYDDIKVRTTAFQALMEAYPYLGHSREGEYDTGALYRGEHVVVMQPESTGPTIGVLYALSHKPKVNIFSPAPKHPSVAEMREALQRLRLSSDHRSALDLLKRAKQLFDSNEKAYDQRERAMTTALGEMKRMVVDAGDDLQEGHPIRAIVKIIAGIASLREQLLATTARQLTRVGEALADWREMKVE